MKKLVTYKETVDIIIKKINESNKTYDEISKESGVAYNVINLIKNKYKKPYPRAIVKLLKYFNINAERVMAFEIEEVDQTPES
jgi:hypothetical protein